MTRGAKHLKPPRVCSRCGALVSGACDTCTKALREKIAAGVEGMSADDRAVELLELVKGKLETAFADLHKRAEQLVGRAVWTHEFADPDTLAAEIRSGKTVSMDVVLDKLLGLDKPVIIVCPPRRRDS